MKKLALLPALALALSALCVPASAATPSIPKTAVYTEGQFSDVPSASWFSQGVKTAYEYGIMNGTSATSFGVSGNLTYAQAIVMSCRLHALCGGQDGVTVTADGPWYQPYVDYAKQNGIPCDVADFNVLVSRADFALILGAALPDESLPEISRVEEGAIPDVPAGAAFYDAAYRLYRAGVLTGNSASNAFEPQSRITRAEAATIVSRLVEPSLRKSFILMKGATAATAAKLYDVIETGLSRMVGLTDDAYIDLKDFHLPNNSQNRALLSNMFYIVFYDHPEFFFLPDKAGETSYEFVPSDTNDVLLGLRPLYLDFVKKDPGTIPRFNAAVEKALAQADGITDPVEQMLAMYEYLNLNTVYNHEVAANNSKDAPRSTWTAYAAMIDLDTVCRGYALAYRLLLTRLGINCMVVSSSEMNHVWNLVELDGAWYHVDVNAANNLYPTLKGRCRHERFLLSDKTLAEKGYRDWSKDAYSGWAAPLPTCSSDKYESGWAFNGNTDFPMYRKNGLYYSLRLQNNGLGYTLYRGKLSEEGEKVADIPVNMQSGVVWGEDCFWYVNMDKELICYSLPDGQSSVLSTVPSTPQSPPGTASQEDNDGVSLYLDEGSGQLVAESSAQRVELARFAVRPPA